MRGPAFLLAVAALVGAVGFAAAQDIVTEPAATEDPAADQPSGSEQPPADEVQSGDPASVNPNPLSGLTLDSLAATRSAPLFTPSRTAPVVDAPVEQEAVTTPMEAAPPAEEPPPQLELIGIILTENSQMALLRDPSTNEVHRLASGEQFNNWELKIVDPRSVEFHQGDRVHEFKMFDVFPVSAVSGDPSGEDMPPEINGPMQRPMSGTDDPNNAQRSNEPPDQSAPQSSDIVQGAEDVQNSDIVRAPNATDDPNGAGSPDRAQNPNAVRKPSGGPEPADGAPPPDFVPPVGSGPMPDEGAPPPDANSN